MEQLNLNWSNLPFGYMKTDFNVRLHFKDGAWGDIEVSDDENISLHMAVSSLHYGQEAFEGLKAFRGKDGKIRIFRLEENGPTRNTSFCRILRYSLKKIKVPKIVDF